MGKDKYLLIPIFIMVVISSLTTIMGIYLLKPLLNNYIIPGDVNGMIRNLGLMAIIYAIGAMVSYIYGRLLVIIGERCTFALRQDLFYHTQDLGIAYFDKHPYGNIMSYYTNDLGNVAEVVSHTAMNMLLSILTFVGIMVMLVVLSPILGAITIAFIILMLLITRFLGMRIGKFYKVRQADLGALNSFIEEMIEGQKIIQLFNYQEKAIERFKVLNHKLKESSTGAETNSGMMMPVIVNISYINFALTSLVGSILVVSGGFTLGALVAYLSYVRMVIQPISQVAQQTSILFSAKAGLDRIFTLIDEKPEIDEGHIKLIKNGDNQRYFWKDGDKQIELRGDIQFENVTFGYTDKPVLKDLNLYANAGQKVAFVGSTGAGKTTITNLINRFYEINEGKITYDGIDITKICKADLRKSLGIVLQDTHLFTGTIRENIRYGNLKATDEEVYQAAKLAHATDFINQLPEGMDTLLERDGENLSQGQRQLLNIARTALANPPVLILDEATSSIDTRTEAMIAKGMDQLMEGRTVFVIAHRLSTIRNADVIMVLEHGVIVERGSHQDLMDKQGIYYRLSTGQMEL